MTNSTTEADNRQETARKAIAAILAERASAAKQGKVDSAATELERLDPETERKFVENDDIRTDTALKKIYAYWFIGILIGQLLLMNGIFAGVGMQYLKFDEYALHLYMGGTLAEVFGIVLVITKYLFSKKTK